MYYYPFVVKKHSYISFGITHESKSHPVTFVDLLETLILFLRFMFLEGVYFEIPRPNHVFTSYDVLDSGFRG